MLKIRLQGKMRHAVVFSLMIPDPPFNLFDLSGSFYDRWRLGV